MKLTKKLEAEILGVYNKYWDAYIQGNMRMMSSCMDENVQVIGSGQGEVFKNRKESLKYYKATADQVAGKSDIRNRKLSVTAAGNNILVTEESDFFILIGKNWIFYGPARISTLLARTTGKWLIIQQHGSLPDARTGGGEQVNTDKIKAENIRLKDAVKRRTIELEEKNRELEIETALEKVRAIAMGMKAPEDMLNVCKTISLQLQSLGVKEIRNVQTAIFYKSRGIYMNYEYYAKHRKTIITETTYSNHKIHKAFAEKMTQGKGELFITHIKGPKVKEWIAYQKTTNVFIDKYLNKASSLNYYWHSLGPVALGISTYAPLSKTDRELFNRFLNVFELSYRRYLDIEYALAQAREARIEAGLERVRSRSLAMHHTSELQEVINTVHKELLNLNIAINGGSFITINSEVDKALRCWGSGGTADTSEEVILPVYEKPFCTNLINRIKSRPGFFTEEYTQQEKKEFFRFLFKHEPWSKLGAARKKETLTSPGGYTRSCSVSKHTSIFIINHLGEKFSADDNNILQRFGKVFEQSYTRFLDLQKAEAQVREAEIELALERVRARAMAMQKSDELSDLVDTVFKELTKLDFALNWCIINIIDEPSLTNMVWAANPETNKPPESYLMKFENYPFHHSMLKGYQQRKTKHVYVLEGKEKKIYDDYLFNKTEWRRVPKAAQAASRAMIRYVATFTFSNFGGLQTVGEEYLSDENLDILSRFGKVFDLTYTRFNDLLKAEAQAREAEIELALERVRARTMAMQKSEELPEAANLLFQQIQSLEMPAWSAGYCTWNDNKRSVTLWMSTEGTLQPPFKAPTTEDELFIQMRLGEKKGETLHIVEMGGDNLAAHYKYMRTLPVVGGILDSVIEAGHPLPTFQIMHYAYFSKGFLLFITYEPVPTSHDIFIRFAKVFEQTYTRFLDLQKAEAQAREAQIEAALERVRSRTMGMQQSVELGEVAAELFAQMNLLVTNLWTCGFVLCEKNRTEDEWWLSMDTGFTRGFFLPNIGDYAHATLYEGWKKGESFRAVQLEGNDLQEHYTWLMNLPVAKSIFEEMDNAGLERPDWQKLHAAYFSKGYLVLITREPCDEEEIFKRFALVFDQTYTRFLDLQKAEAQAKEAQIETALERVRSRTMGMQRSEELKEVIKIVYQQLILLNIKLDHAGFVVDYKPKGDWTFWIADEQVIPSKITHPYFESVWANQFNKAKEKNTDFFATLLNFEEKNKFYQDLLSYVPGLSEETKDFYLSCPGLAATTVVLEDIGLYIENFAGTPYTDEENKILMRFGKVFQQTYTRFLDLQKAEAQAREAQIETAIERVRSRSLAMHRSEELNNVVMLLFERLKDLGIPVTAAGITTFLEGSKDMNIYVCGDIGKGLAINHYLLPYFDHRIANEYYHVHEKQLELFIGNYSKEEKNSFYKKVFKLEALKDLPDEIKNMVFNSNSYTITMAGAKNSMLAVNNFAGEQLSQSEIDIIKRFAKVFDQAYVRFLDLQKAEAQAREGQIQLALERVRARTMAMQKSDELSEAVHVLFEQFRELGENPDQATIGIINENDGVIEYWVTMYGNTINKVFRFPFDEPNVTRKIYNAWKEDKRSLVIKLSGKALQDFMTYRAGKGGAAVKPEEKRRIIHVAFFSKGLLNVQFNEEHTEETIRLLERFASVFEQTYTRFLDLQKAEAQVREAQIEAALERTRTQSMLMQHSEQLDDTLRVFHEQVLLLGIPSAFSFLWLPDEEKDRHIFWAAWAENNSTDFRSKAINYPMDRKEPATAQCLIDWKGKEPVVSYQVPPVGVVNYFAAWQELIDGVEHLKPEYFTGGLYYVEAFMKYGCFGVMVTNDLSDEEKKILGRFAIEFERTYTRFLDLKNAETLAQKAKIEVALERVRARALAMQQPEELKEVAEVLRHEMGLLGVEELETCSIYINDVQAEKAECWYALKDLHAEEKKLVNDHFALNLNDTWVGREMLKFYQSDEKQISIVMQGANRKEWIRMCEEKSAPFRGYYGQVIPDRTYHLYKFSHGSIGAAAAGDISEESWGLLKRAASVFSLAYSRFKDLTQARTDLVNLKDEKKKAEDALTNLKAAQSQLIQSEKMASLGELTAGIAHEIQNPLNFVNNFSEVSKELLDEMREAIEKGETEEAKEIMHDVIQNLEKINHHGKRADGIVKGMLQHSRSSSGVKEPTDINALADEYLRLAYHGLRAKDKSFNATIKTDFDESIGSINIIPQDIGRVILNLITNAFYVVEEKKKQIADGYEPTVSVSTKKEGNKVTISVKDNGNGIPQKVLDKIFQPFFTTKPTGQGTGLGLSLSYDIIKAHGGEIKVNTKENEGTAFIIQLPV